MDRERQDDSREVWIVDDLVRGTVKKIDNLNLGCDDVIDPIEELGECHSLYWVQLQHLFQ